MPNKLEVTSNDYLLNLLLIKKIYVYHKANFIIQLTITNKQLVEKCFCHFDTLSLSNVNRSFACS